MLIDFLYFRFFKFLKMLAFSEIIKSRMPKKQKKKKGSRFNLLEKFLEIVLIILSVYIALVFEGWSERRKDHERLMQYYSNFITELNRDIQDLKDEQKDAENHVNNCKKHIQLLTSDGSPDSIKVQLLKMNESVFFLSSKMLSYKSMVESGDLKLIENIEVRKALVEMEEAFLGVKVREDMYLNLCTKDMIDYFKSNFDMIKGRPFKEDFYKSIDYRNLVILFRNHNVARLEEYKNAITTLTKTLGIIKQEYEKEQ